MSRDRRTRQTGRAGTERAAGSTLRRLWYRLLSGYGVVLRAGLGIVAIAAATLVAAVAFVFPLWYLATTVPGIYTAAVSALLAALVLALLVRRYLRLLDAVRRGEYTRRHLLRRARAVAVVLGVIVLAYVAALLLARGRIAAAGVTSVVLLIAIGLPAGRLSGRDADSA